MIIRIVVIENKNNKVEKYIYCPNQINIKRKNLKSKFFEWYKSVENEEYQLVQSLYGDSLLEHRMVYWINTYILDYEYGNKAYIIQDNVKDITKYDININIEWRYYI